MPWEGIVDGGFDEAGVSTAAPDRSAVLCGWMYQGQGGYSQICCSSTPTGASKPPQERIVTECLRPTPADNLPILAGIQPAELRRNEATLSLARRAMEPGHLLHSTLTSPSSADARRLKSRHPFVPAAQHLISSSDNNSIRAAQWADHQWNASGGKTPQDSNFHPRHRRPSPGTTLPRTAWVRA